MILQCPQCNARFIVANALIPPEGRTVKCGKCAHQWHAAQDAEPSLSEAAVAPPAAESVNMAEAPAAAPPEVMRNPPVPAIKPLAVPMRPIKTAVPLLALAWLVIALYAYFPGGQDMALLRGIYGALGVTSTHGLEFSDVTMEREDSAGGTRFLLSGSIANTDAVARTVPNVRVQLKDDAQEIIWERTYVVNIPLDPGQVYPFRIDNVASVFADKARAIVMDIGNNFELVMR